MEHITLFAICTLIMQLSLPLSTYDIETTEGLGNTHFLHDAVTSASFSAALAVPLWAAFELIYWVGRLFI